VSAVRAEVRVRDSPYQGLVPYSEADADRFFGRDSEREIIISNLMARRLTLLYGESGVGKSSVLHAGVVHHLQLRARRDLAERGAARAVPIVFSSWRDDPIAALAGALREQGKEFVPGGGDLDLPRSAKLDELVDDASKALHAKILLILDQFEEYFVYHESEDGEGTLATDLPRLLSRPEVRANVLIAIREDALAKLDRFKGRIPHLMTNRLHIHHLDRDAARAAIEKPVDYYNEIHGTAISLEPELRETVLDQVEAGKVVLAPGGAGIVDGGESSGNGRGRVETPYLQLVMERLWDEEMATGSSELRLGTLTRLGGADRIVRTHLDEAMSKLPATQRDRAADLFRFLVTPGGTKIALTARDLADYTGHSPDELQPILDHLRETRIVRPESGPDGRPDSTRYEIFHDVLAAAVLDWRARHKHTAEQRELAKKLEEERERKLDAEAEARQAHEQAARERRRARIFRLVMVACALLAAVAAGAFVYALNKQNEAEERSKRAESIAIASTAALDDPNAALLAGVEAYELGGSFEARSLILGTLQLNAGLPQILAGQARSVNGIVFSPDSAIIATGGSDGVVRLWDAPTGRPLGNPLRGHDGVVLSVSYSPDGQTLASGGDDAIVRLWDVSDPANVPKPAELTAVGLESVNVVAFSPDRKTLATGHESGAVQLWDVSNPEDARSLGPPLRPRHGGAVWGLAFRPDGARLASGGADPSVRLWDVSNPRRAQALPPLADTSGGAVSSLAFGRKGELLAAAREDGLVSLWEFSGSAEPRYRELRGHTDDVYGVSFNADASVLVSGGADDKVVFWSLQTDPPRPFGPPRTHSDDVRGVAISPDGRVAASASADTTAKLWPLADTGALAAALGSSEDAAPEFRIGAGDLLVSASSAAGVRLWNLRGYGLGSETLSAPAPREPLESLPLEAANGYSLDLRGDLLATTSGSTFTLWNVRTASRPQELGSPASAHDGDVWVLALSPDGKTLASGSLDKTVILWDVSDPEEPQRLATIDDHSDSIDDIEFSPQGGLLATASDDGDIRLWDVRDRRRPKQLGQPLRGHEGAEVYELAFDPKGRVLASGGADQRIVLWDVTEPARAKRIGLPLGPHTQSILALAFDPDGKILAAGDGDGSVVLWDVNARRGLGLDLRVNAYTEGGAIDSVSFDRRGRYLISSGRKNPIVVWSSVLWSKDEDVLRKYACRISRRNLTALEWRTFFSSTELASKRQKTCSEWPLGD